MRWRRRGKGAGVAVDRVSFDTSGLQMVHDADAARAWTTESGDLVSIEFFDLPPDIGAPLDDLDLLQRFYVDASSGVANPIEIDVRGGSFRYLRMIMKVPQQPSGMAYVGSLTVPFEQFSFVIKIQCAEHPPTGIRDTVVFNDLLGAGLLGPDPMASFRSPQSAALSDVMVPRNLSEDEKYDADFPAHPLSRCRALLAPIEHSLQLDPSLEAVKPFAGPTG